MKSSTSFSLMEKSPVDGYYSWIIAVASSVLFLLVSLPARLGAQLFVTMVDQYDITREAASFPFALVSLMRSASGPFAGFFSGLLGLQGVTLCGCLFCTIGIGACFFAESVETIDVCLGIIAGTGFGWSTALIPEILNQYFEKHRNKAYGIFMAGSGIGAFIGPPVLEIILKQYGMSGAFLIMCGIIFNSVAAALLLKNPKFRVNKCTHSLEENETMVSIIAINQKISNNEETFLANGKISAFGVSEECNHQTKVSSHKINTSNKFNDFIVEKGVQNNIELTSFEKSVDGFNKKYSLDSAVTISPFWESTISNTTPVLNDKNELQQKSPVLVNVHDLDKQFSQPSGKQNIKMDDKHFSGKTDKYFLNSINVFWHPIFLCMTIIHSSNVYVNYVFWTITVDVVRDKGIKSHLEIYFVMGMNLFDVFGRLFQGMLIDSGCMSITNCSACCFLIMCLACLLLTWISSFSLMMFVLCLLGLVFGANTAIMPATVKEFIAKEKRSMAMASRLVMYIPMSFTISPLIGYFRGQLGSYDGYMYMMASLCLICCIGTLLLSRFVNSRNRKDGN